MASPYEVEHNIKNAPKSKSRRPDMSSFFSQIDQVETSLPTHNNPHAQPTPADREALNNLVFSQLSSIQASLGEDSTSELLDSLMQAIQGSETSAIQGVPQSYLDELDRVPNKTLNKTDTCPICTEAYLDDQYPLVVVLPCHSSHKFHLECVGPWLRLNGTCPLDRKELLKKKVVVQPVEDEEEGFDDMYA